MKKHTFSAYFFIVFRYFQRFFVPLPSDMVHDAININGSLFSLAHPRVMAIINATPDSFAFSCTNIAEADFLAAAGLALNQGADILDIGACSTRPGAVAVDESEEWRRLEIALSAIRKAFPDAVLSVDTFRSSIARRAVEQFGVRIINDISGGEDPDMFATVAQLQVPYILTHSQQLQSGRPVTEQVLDFLVRQADKLHRLGVRDVVIDPGFGFEKNVSQNYELLAHLADLKLAQLPILVGISRKSMIYKVLNVTPQSDAALHGTLVAQMMALAAGASILRVHDVAAAKLILKHFEK